MTKKKPTTLEFFVLPLARSPPSDTYPVSVLGYPGEPLPNFEGHAHLNSVSQPSANDSIQPTSRRHAH